MGKGIPLSPVQREAMTMAVGLGMIVEAHSYSDPAQWEELIQAGVRMFHTTLPTETLQWLAKKGWR